MGFHFGYIDPSSGSIIWQAAVGGILGGAYVLRNGVAKMVNRGRSLVSRSSAQESVDGGSETEANS